MTKAAPRRVREARVLGPGEGERRDPQLTHAPQALDLGRIEEALDDPLLFPFERHQPVDRIAQDHGRSSTVVATPPSSYQTRTASEAASRRDHRLALDRAGASAGRSLRMPPGAKGSRGVVRGVDRPGEGLARREELDPDTLALRRNADFDLGTAPLDGAKGTAALHREGSSGAQEPGPRCSDRERRRIADDKAPSQAMRALGGRPGSAEQVHHQATRGASAREDTVEQGARLLGRKARPLLRARMAKGRDVRPQRVHAPLAAIGAILVLHEKVLHVRLARSWCDGRGPRIRAARLMHRYSRREAPS